jgi:hypothetical protein
MGFFQTIFLFKNEIIPISEDWAKSPHDCYKIVSPKTSHPDQWQFY